MSAIEKTNELFQGVPKYIINKDPVKAEQYLKKMVQPNDRDEVIDYEGAFFHDGKLLLLIKKVEAENVRKAVMSIKKRPTSHRLSGLVTSSIVFGYLPKDRMKQAFCAKKGMALGSKAVDDILTARGREYYDIYKNSFDVPTWLEEEIKEKMIADYFIDGTLYTSGIINKNNNLAYHRDQGNYPGLFCALLLLKNKIRGGRLSIPEFRIAVEAPDSSVVLFDNQSVIHGVEKIKLIDKTSYRYSIVWYNMFKIKFCNHIEEEIKEYAEYQTKQLLKKAKTIQEVFDGQE